MIDIVAIGEYLVDFTQDSPGITGNPLYEMNPGGAPANCLGSASALGARTSLISALGDDLFARFLIKELDKYNIGSHGIQTTNKASTTLAFVSLDSSGEREFAFVREPGADTLIDKYKIDEGLIERAKILHFGSLSMTNEPSRSATMYAVKKAKEMGKIISYDPNYRKDLWESEEEAIRFMKEGLKWADSVKLSESELELILGYKESRVEDGIEALLDMGISNVYITAGGKGAYYGDKNEIGFVEGYSVKVVDTTGCGDSFNGSILYLYTHQPDMKTRDKVRFANAVGALCATKRGGLPAMPSLNEVKDFMNI